MTTTRKQSALVKYYLVTYSVLSTLGWSWILILTLVHVFNLDGKSAAIQSTTGRVITAILAKAFASAMRAQRREFNFRI
ncbi:hypothetical protein ARMGADRAFT_1013838, partial [Armillaria gallica]